MRMEYLFLLPLLIALAITTSPIFATTDDDNNDNNDNPGEGDDQRDRVGNEDEHDRDGPDDEREANCWGKVTSDAVSEPGDDDDGIGGRAFGEHASNPPGDDDNPRAGVGNQLEDHPSDHADTVGG